MNRKLDEIRSIGSRQEPLKVNENDLRKVVKDLKKRKSADSAGITNELVKYGGEEMVKSLVILINVMLEKMVIPKQWEDMKVKSIYKNKGRRSDMRNRIEESS